jgi:hypothetical protein
MTSNEQTTGSRKRRSSEVSISCTFLLSIFITFFYFHDIVEEEKKQPNFCFLKTILKNIIFIHQILTHRNIDFLLLVCLNIR